MNPSPKNKITLFIVISVLIHFLLFFLLRDGLEKYTGRNREGVQKPIWLDLKKLDAPQEIADIPKPAQEEIPDRASAQALYNQKVKEETVNPNRELGVQGSGFSKPSTPHPVPRTPNLYSIKNPEPAEKALPTPQEELSKPQRMPGIPQEESSGAPAADDYFPNYKIGDRTYLNTLANPNIAYYVELKRKFKLTFNPEPSLRANINEISRGKIDVVVGVSVNQRGELVNLMVLRSSGLESYDREGMRTVSASAPFSSPPAHLLTSDGLMHMAWTFIVYL